MVDKNDIKIFSKIQKLTLFFLVCFYLIFFCRFKIFHVLIYKLSIRQHKRKLRIFWIEQLSGWPTHMYIFFHIPTLVWKIGQTPVSFHKSRWQHLLGMNGNSGYLILKALVMNSLRVDYESGKFLPPGASSPPKNPPEIFLISPNFHLFHDPSVCKISTLITLFKKPQHMCPDPWQFFRGEPNPRFNIRQTPSDRRQHLARPRPEYMTYQKLF